MVPSILNNNKENILRITIVLTAIALSLVACASNQPTQSVESSDDASASAGETPGRKKVCKYERSRSTGSRMEKVCRFVSEE